MLFNSFDFIIFLPTVFFLYWFLFNKSFKSQNILLLISSCFFYSWWDWRFLFLILFSASIDYFIGHLIHKEKNFSRRKIILFISIFLNIGLLGFFKYFNFFIESFVDAFCIFGYKINASRLDVILPVGISFFTFQTLGYSIDIYRKKITPCHNIISFYTFVCFFPQLVAGPIERASNLLPQFNKKRNFNYNKAVDGLKQILLGFFKKIVIADNCAIYVNEIFLGYTDFESPTLILGAILFSIQIYCDFSGYSDIAIGTGKLFNINLMQNFAFPYFSKSIAEFWKKWHISLSTWLNDYVFTSLALSFRNHKKKGVFLGVLITFLISGLWHGAGWNYLFWGGLHGLFYIPIVFSKKRFISISNKIFIKDDDLSFFNLIKIIKTFSLVTLTFIFFRSNTLKDGFLYTVGLSNGIFDKNSYINLYNYLYWEIGCFIPIIIILFCFIEWVGRNNKYSIENLQFYKYSFLRYLFYFLLFLLTFLCCDVSSSEFIYFQF